MKRPLPALFTLLALSTAAHAQSPWYAGISIGQTRTGGELAGNRESVIGNASNISSAQDGQDTGGKVYAGFRVNRVIALEVLYADLGSSRTFTTLTAGGPGAGPLASTLLDRKISGYGVDIVATAPLDWRNVNLFGRVGRFRARVEATMALEGAIIFANAPNVRSISANRQDTVTKVGIGADWWLARNVGVRLEYERYWGVGRAFTLHGTGAVGEADQDMMSVGVMARF